MRGSDRESVLLEKPGAGPPTLEPAEERKHGHDGGLEALRERIESGFSVSGVRLQRGARRLHHPHRPALL